MAAVDIPTQLSAQNPCIEDESQQVCQGDGINTQICREFKIFGNKSNAVNLIIPKLTLPEFSLKGDELDVLEFTSARKIVGKCGWTVQTCQRSSASSSTQEEKEPGQSSFSINLSSQQRILPSSFFTRCYRGKNTVEDFENGRLISSNGCDITGCPVLVAQKQYCESICYPAGFITKSWCLTVAGMIGRVNEFTFRDCQPCEMLLTGVTANKQGVDGLWQVNFCWTISPNVIYVMDVLDTVTYTEGSATPSDVETCPKQIAIGGHDHVVPVPHCYRFPEGNELVIEEVCVNQVYPKVDFAIAI